MKFHAFDYKTSQDTEITPETSGDMNTAIITSEITDIAAETSGTTSVKIYGAMTFEEFKVFKLSLPIPNERRDDYIIRINKLASLAKRDGIKEHVEPEILPEELYQNLFDSYPKETNRNYDDYLENMECKNSIPVSRDTFDKLLKVSNSMDYNPYTFDYSSFYKIIVTSKDQLSYPSWPWYVDSGKQN
ncbi:uncharacterized protein LOC111040237 [Myzus persicae]|uniref:uncharacterized protein LOC111040237 n=1 Tax=Myzus persicae TaxID=13164 RepID=UPI000B9356EE|nr:uncharacterized protein LOC111040237 [Myzus persicae]